jgi:chitodextrinase
MDNNTNNTTDTTAPYSRTLDTTTLTNGTHTLGLTVTLTDGTVEWQSYQVGTVTVNNPVNPPPDTTAPTVSITAPAANASVSGSNVALTATAADNVAVSGVQFKLDGNNLGPEDTTSPYAYTWDTTTLGNGTYTLTAVARDAAGNTKTSTSVPVTVNNVTVPPPDTTAPTTPANLTNSGKTTTSISLAWNASTDTGGSGLAGYKVYKNGTFLASTTQLTYTDTGLTAASSYSYKLASYDNAGNTSAQTSALSVTTDSNPTPTPTPTPTADFNADHTVNIIDFSIFLTHYNTNYAACDLNSDGTVNIIDFSVFLTKWGTQG